MNTKRNKMICLLFATLMVAVLLSGTALAHSGGTDSEGGHYDTRPGNTITTTVGLHTATRTRTATVSRTARMIS